MKRVFTKEERTRGIAESHKRAAEKARIKYETTLAGGVTTSSISPRILKRFLIERTGEFCFKCQQGPEWQGRPLTLELDHIDGDATNNKFENLQLLCPNCHSQTSTYKAKNKGRSTREYFIVPRIKNQN